MPAVGNVITGKGTVPAGGTTNQNLSKIDGTDYNVQWVTPVSGGNVSNSGTPTAGQDCQWVSATLIKGVTYASYQGAAIAGPISQSTTAALMVGLAGVITPTATGKVVATISGTIRNDTANSGAIYTMRWGTGTAPILNAALTGTAVGGSAQIGLGTYGANSRGPFSLSAVITGLTLNQTIWLDLSGAAVTSGNAIVSNTSVCAFEIP